MTSPANETANADGESRHLRPGIKNLFISLVIAAISLTLCCYALGIGVTSTGPVDDGPPDVQRIPLAFGMMGFGLSILMFWSGYLRLARR